MAIIEPTVIYDKFFDPQLSVDVTTTILKTWIDDIGLKDQELIRHMDEEMLLNGFKIFCNNIDHYRPLVQSIYYTYFDDGKLVTLVKFCKKNSMEYNKIIDKITFHGKIEGKFEL